MRSAERRERGTLQVPCTTATQSADNPIAHNQCTDTASTEALHRRDGAGSVSRGRALDHRREAKASEMAGHSHQTPRNTRRTIAPIDTARGRFGCTCGLRFIFAARSMRFVCLPTDRLAAMCLPSSSLSDCLVTVSVQHRSQRWVRPTAPNRRHLQNCPAGGVPIRSITPAAVPGQSAPLPYTRQKLLNFRYEECPLLGYSCTLSRDQHGSDWYAQRDRAWRPIGTARIPETRADSCGRGRSRRDTRNTDAYLPIGL
jgi:hypothetical protein